MSPYVWFTDFQLGIFYGECQALWRYFQRSPFSRLPHATLAQIVSGRKPFFCGFLRFLDIPHGFLITHILLPIVVPYYGRFRTFRRFLLMVSYDVALNSLMTSALIFDLSLQRFLALDFPLWL